jgi:hypothetical protein
LNIWLPPGVARGLFMRQSQLKRAFMEVPVVADPLTESAQ